MPSKQDLEIEVLMAARNLGIGTILFRNTLAKNQGLNLTESLCLTLLGVKGSLSPTELSRVIGLTTGATTTMLDRLEKKGYLVRKPNPQDRRGILLELTDHPNGSTDDRILRIQAAHKELIHGYSPEELTTLLGFLNGFTSNMAKNSTDVNYLFGEGNGTGIDCTE